MASSQPQFCRNNLKQWLMLVLMMIGEGLAVLTCYKGSSNYYPRAENYLTFGSCRAPVINDVFNNGEKLMSRCTYRGAMYGYNGGCETTASNIMDHTLYGDGPAIQCQASGWKRIFISPSKKKPHCVCSLPINQSSYPLRTVSLFWCALFCTANGCPG